MKSNQKVNISLKLRRNGEQLRSSYT